MLDKRLSVLGPLLDFGRRDLPRVSRHQVYASVLHEEYTIVLLKRDILPVFDFENVLIA